MLVLLACESVQAQNKPDLETQAVRTETPPVIDGEINDEVWQSAPLLTDFQDTLLDKPAEFQTFARVLYDDEYLYIAAEMIQDPTTIMATVRKYDRFTLRFEDYLQVGFDTFFNRKEAYLFLVSPLGVRWDARDSTFGRNDSWDAPWEAKTTVKEDRWFAEMRIPIGVMHHSRGEAETWGFNFRRSQRQANIFSHWNYDHGAGVPRRAMGPKFIADFGNLTGLDLSNSVVRSETQYEVYGSTLLTREDSGDFDTQLSTGLDISTRLNSNWISTFALNPDFGQVEADSDTIELRDTERFLPERRPFFNEGAELFRTPINVYNSRRILDIAGGAKITGAGEKWSAGVLDVQGESERSGNANFLVSRYIYNPTQDLQLGGMLVNALRHNGFNAVLGPDIRYNLNPSTTWTSQYMHMIDMNDEAVDSGGNQVTEWKSEHAFETELSGGNQPLFWEIDFKKITPEFETDLGFIPRKDIIGPGINFMYRNEVDRPKVQNYNGFVDFQYYQNHSGKTVLRDYFGMVGIDLQSNWDFQLGRSKNFRIPYTNRLTMFQIEYNRQNRLKSWEVDFSGGRFEGVPFKQVDLSKPFGIGDRFTTELTGSYRQERPEVVTEPDEDVWLARIVSEYTFKWEGRIKLTIEQSSEDRYNRTLLFAYEDVKTWDFYIVLNDVLSNGEKTRGIFTKLAYRF